MRSVEAIEPSRTISCSPLADAHAHTHTEYFNAGGSVKDRIARVHVPLVDLVPLSRGLADAVAPLPWLSFPSVNSKRMVEQAEKDGRLIPGKSVIIEPSE